MEICAERPDIALVNGNALTLDAAQPLADAVLIRDGCIAWVGERDNIPATALAAAQVIDCGGLTVVPGFMDAHCHILAYAASLAAVDCSSSAVYRIDDIGRKIRRRAEGIPRGEWIRAAGYSEFDLREKRHPTRWELDRVAPYHPVRLNHRSGHACVLNSLALERVGINIAAEEPPGGTITRNLSDGEPNGLLLEMNDWLDERIPRIDEPQLLKATALASREFLAQGITSVSDATASNSIDRWDFLRGLTAKGVFVPSLTVMPGARHLIEFGRIGIGFGEGEGSATLGHAKVMLVSSGGKLYPQNEDLAALIEDAHLRGFPVAIHAVGSDEVIAAAEALADNRVPGLRDRIEHASECPPDAFDAILRARPVVVSQPRFIRDSGARYISEFGENARWLYRFSSLIEGGLTLAASSDAPVSAPSPLTGMHAAITRHVESGEVIGEGESLTAIQALEMHTKNAAYAACREDELGTIAAGKRADLAVLNYHPLRDEPDSLLDARAMMTIIGGEVVWEA